jgi:hypothetical protein
MDVKPGSRWRSAVCDAEVVVIKAPKSPISLECGGEPLAPAAEPRELKPIRSGLGGGVLIGKRYVDDASGLELLCNKAGRGTLAANGAPLRIKDAQKLPSSD